MAVAERSSVTKAANALHLAQPTVSTQIGRLADALQCKLFEQVGKQLFLTDAGKDVLKATRELFDVMANLEMRLAQRAGLSIGQVRISAVTTAKYIIPDWLGRFCEQFPEVEPEFQIGNRAEVIQRLKQNLDDLYVFSHPPKELDIEAQLLTENPLVVIAKRDHPLGKRKKISWQELEHERLLMREVGSGTRYAIEKFFQLHNLTMQRPVTIASNEAIKESVVAGLGISILSRHALKHMAPGNLIELPVQNFPIPNSWYWVTPRGKQASPAAAAFRQFVEGDVGEPVDSTNII
jgi:DNA-binding transcriptional LysR family regulator